MRIALVCDWAVPRTGGVELQVLDLALALRERGHEPLIVTATPGAPAVFGIPVRRFRVVEPPLWGAWARHLERRTEAQFPALPYPWLLGQLQRLFDRERIDAVHAHSVFSMTSLFSGPAAHRLGIPEILTNHSLLRGTGHRYLHTLGSIVRWQDWPRTLTAVSAAAAADLRAAAHGRNAVVIPNGIDVAAWRVDDRAAHDDVRVVSVLRLSPRKRPADLLAAIPRVLARVAGRRISFAVVGDGPLRPELEHEAARLGVAGAVRFLGHRTRAEVRALLAAADVFALPTVAEAFGIAALEARCAGLPVIGMGGNGLVDVVGHGRDGLLADTPDDFAEHLAEVCVDDALRRRLACAAGADLERFDWSRVAAEYESAYRAPRS